MGYFFLNVQNWFKQNDTKFGWKPIDRFTLWVVANRPLYSVAWAARWPVAYRWQRPRARTIEVSQVGKEGGWAGWRTP